jgi:hypothetical protein
MVRKEVGLVGVTLPEQLVDVQEPAKPFITIMEMVKPEGLVTNQENV